MFTQLCFIRKNTSELRKKLEELGYKYNGYDASYGTLCNLYCSFDSYYELSGPAEPSRYESVIDCGTNEELFLALAALRDDTSINQYYWFNDRLFKCEGLEFDRVLKNNTANYLLRCRDVDNPMIISCFKERKLRKATVKEIIEHFKDE